jgi:hypothetical protein
VGFRRGRPDVAADGRAHAGVDDGPEGGLSPTTVAGVVFVCAFGGALVGLRLRAALPEHHLGNEARDTVKLGIGLVATITALILGLVTASAKEAFDSADRALKDAAANVLSLDRVLARYGPETAEIRAALKRTVAERIDVVWANRHRGGPVDIAGSTHEIELLPANIRSLQPKTDAQQGFRARALDLVETMMRSRWHVSVGLGTRSVRSSLLCLCSGSRSRSPASGCWASATSPWCRSSSSARSRWPARSS